jgi:polar amino acid transport system substrate-binding protein
MNVESRIEDQIARWMVEEAPDVVPDRLLHAVFERTETMPQDRPRSGPGHLRARALLLAAAVLIMVGSLLTTALVGGWLARPAEPLPSPDALQRLEAAGTLRIAVRPEQPQTALADGTLDGFDVDVARDISRRLGLRLVLVALAPDEMLARPEAWDVGLPSTPAWTIDAKAFTTTVAYYAWPHILLVPAGSGATSVADVEGQPICAITGDPGQAWLLGQYPGEEPRQPSTPPIPSTLILRESDTDCLAELETGRVRAVVTATLTPAEVAALADVVAIGGPEAEPRVAIIRRAGQDSATLAEAVDRAIETMRSDGTLSAISHARFASDLTPTAP